MKRIRRLSLIAAMTLLSVLVPLGLSYSPKVSATVTGTNSLVSYDSTNTSPVGGDYAAISDDGNFVAYISSFSNVVAGDTNGKPDMFLRNLRTGTTTLVDQSTSGTQTVWGVVDNGNALAISRTGRYVLFTSPDAHLIDGQTIPGGGVHLYLRDTVMSTTTLIDTTTSGTLGNDEPSVGAISDDGRYVVFLSKATNLGGGTNGNAYLYMKDMSTNTLQVLSHSASGTNANSSIGNALMSCDGSFVAFVSSATNLTPSNNGHASVYLLDLRNGFSITNVTLAANNHVTPTGMSCSGQYLTLTTAATNLTADSVDGTTIHVFRYDRFTGQYALIDQSGGGHIASSNSGSAGFAGRRVSDLGAVLFMATDKSVVSPAASYTGEMYLRTPENNTTELVAINSSGQEGSPAPFNASSSISADGRNIVHLSKATNLIPGITTALGNSGNVVLSKVQ